VGRSFHQVMNSVEFVHTLGSLQVRAEDLMVSFNVASVFTKVPVVESLNLLTQHFSENNLALFRHVLTSTSQLLGNSTSRLMEWLLAPRFALSSLTSL
jgi:hypothetical protein